MARRETYRWANLAIAAFVVLGSWTGARADTVIGNWESAAPEGWIDWNTGTLQDIMAPRFAFNSIGATVGTGALQFNLPASAYTQWAALKLQGNGVDEWRDDFLANSKLAVDITLVKSEMDPVSTNDFVNIGMTVNADGYGFTDMGDPESVTPFTGFNGGNSFNPQLLVGTQTSTWTWDISQVHDADPTTPVAPRTPGDVAVAPNYVEIVFSTYSNGGVVYHIDNVRLFTPSLAGDFDNNNVVDGLDLGNWRAGFGLTGQADDSNGDANGDGRVDGGDFAIWQRQLGATFPSTGVASAVPEPATIGLVVASLVVVMTHRRRAIIAKVPPLI